MADRPYDELRKRVDAALAAHPDPRPYAQVLEGRMRVYAVLQVLELVVLLTAPWMAVKVLVALWFGVYRARTFWTIIHERVHRRELPNTPAKLFFDLCTVFLARWWRMHHLKHHANTNTDEDPDATIWLGRDLNDVRRDGPRPGRALRFLTTVAQFPFLFVLFMRRSLIEYPTRQALGFLAFVAVYPLGTALLLPQPEAAIHGFANFYLGGLYVLITFAATHSATRENFELTGDVLVDAYVATNDVWPDSTLWTWFCGGINLHIEHHLFPRVPYHRLPLVVEEVRRFAEEKSLPYNAWSPVGLWRAHLSLLWRS